MTKATRQKMSEAAKARWAKHKANGNGYTPVVSDEQENELVQMARVLELYAKLAPAAQLYVHNRIV